MKLHRKQVQRKQRFLILVYTGSFTSGLSEVNLAAPSGYGVEGPLYELRRHVLEFPHH
jgi:hypothetical protein